MRTGSRRTGTSKRKPGHFEAPTCKSRASRSMRSSRPRHQEEARAARTAGQTAWTFLFLSPVLHNEERGRVAGTLSRLLGEQSQSARLKRICGNSGEVETDNRSRNPCRYPKSLTICLSPDSPPESAACWRSPAAPLIFLEKDMECGAGQVRVDLPGHRCLRRARHRSGHLYVIVPKFIDLLKDLGHERLPVMTQMLVDFSTSANAVVYRPAHCCRVVGSIKYFGPRNRAARG